MRQVLIIVLTVLGMGVGYRAEARQFYQLGGHAGTPWSESGTLSFIDVAKVPGAIRPFSAESGENLIASMGERNGDITSLVSIYTLPANWLEERVLIVDGDSNTAFVHPPRINFFRGPGFFYTTPMFFDLGAPFPIEGVRFATRADNPGHKIHGREESKNEKGNLIWTLVHDEKDNLSPVVELDIEPQIARHVYLHPLEVGETWEVAEFEVYGQGFVPQASFLSDPIDLGRASSLGRIWWNGDLDPEAKIVIQSRSGSDDQPEVYWRKTGVGGEEVPFGANGQPMSRQNYEAMPKNVRGNITQEHTYEYADGLAGIQIRSPSPRQYVQLHVAFFSARLAGGQIDSLFFEFSQPPVVSEAIGEIYPPFVESADPVRFTYAVRARLEAEQAGFNVFEVRTSARLEAIHEVRIDREVVAFTPSFDPADPHQFAVQFARIDQDQTLLEVDFDARVFNYGTAFNGAVSDADSDEVPQSVIPGDAISELLSDDLNVRTPLKGSLLSAVQVVPNPFSPNGDGINDKVQFSYTLLRLTDVVPLETEIYTLAGNRVRTLGAGEGGSALYQTAWDGRDDQGELVDPGLYIYRVVVEAGSGREERLGAIALAY
ncbi:MAG: gliding motility-associated C-terminal domain-containing protein [Candidatus Latescibacteria bacterium]|nr:gliding motility-associated C-terminal domain-containing protein [Candidatus Latescibacterota bacterium]